MTTYFNHIRIALNSIIQRASEHVPGLSNTEIWEDVRFKVFDPRMEFLSEDELFNFLLRLASLFARRDCQDKSLMTRMFYLVWKKRSEYYPLLTRRFMGPRFYGIIRTRDEREKLRSFITDDFMKIFSVPYKEAQIYDVRGDSVTYTAVAGDIILLKLLLKFGAIMIQPPEQNLHWRYCELVVGELFSNVPALYNEASLYSNFNQTSKRRLYLILLCLEVLIHLKSPPSDSYDYIASLQHLFKAIPEPIVTTKEISSCLKNLLRGLQKDEEIQTVANEFGYFFPESLQHPGPRSLMHLGRFQVRENLRTAFPFRLPQAVNSLPLPKKLKKYVLLTGEDIV